MTTHRSAPRSLSAAEIVTALGDLRFSNVFNPYSDLCPEYDLPKGPSIRKANLLMTFEAASNGVDEIWLGLEPGHRGARRTGLAMTDEQRLASHAVRWGLNGVKRATRSGPTTEHTAGIVWQALAATRQRVLLWNVFPLHCHRAGMPLTNRRHSRAEWHACRTLLQSILEMTRPHRIVSIGRQAHEAVQSIGLDCVCVRHPAYGGKAEFLNTVNRR